MKQRDTYKESEEIIDTLMKVDSINWNDFMKDKIYALMTHNKASSLWQAKGIHNKFFHYKSNDKIKSWFTFYIRAITKKNINICSAWYQEIKTRFGLVYAYVNKDFSSLVVYKSHALDRFAQRTNRSPKRGEILKVLMRNEIIARLTDKDSKVLNTGNEKYECCWMVEDGIFLGNSYIAKNGAQIYIYSTFISYNTVGAKHEKMIEEIEKCIEEDSDEI